MIADLVSQHSGIEQTSVVLDYGCGIAEWPRN